MRTWIGVFALLWAVSASAESPDIPFTLGQALARVLEQNPQLQAADFDTRAAVARIRQQGLDTPWQVGLQMENLAGSGVGKDLETTLTLGRVMELGNKAALRGVVAEQQAGLLRHEQDAERLDLLAEAAQRFTDIAYAQARRKLAQQQLETAKQTQFAVKRRLRAGKADKAEIKRAEIGIARAELMLEETGHLLSNGRTQLAVLWGEIEPDFQQVVDNLFHMPDVAEFAALERLINNNPTLARLATQERLVDARLQLARAQRQPDVDVSAGVRRFSASDDTGLMFNVSVPLGSRSRAVSYEDEARALAKREPLLAQNRKLALRATLFGLHQELVHESHRLRILHSRIIPAATQAVDDTSRSYSEGRYSLLELTQAQDALLQARLEALDAAVGFHRNRIQIERLTGAVTVQE
ncbi:MAG: TolC family protein [Candidatus Thiodiazotropha lotti]|nr:TolC family protein [Candidatus Thiodiazotropha lotti]